MNCPTGEKILKALYVLAWAHLVLGWTFLFALIIAVLWPL